MQSGGCRRPAGAQRHVTRGFCNKITRKNTRASPASQVIQRRARSRQTFKSKQKAFFFGQRGCMKSHKKHVAEGKIKKPFKPSAPSFRPFWSVNGLTFSLHIGINKKEMLSSVRAMNATFFFQITHQRSPKDKHQSGWAGEEQPPPQKNPSCAHL